MNQEYVYTCSKATFGEKMINNKMKYALSMQLDKNSSRDVNYYGPQLKVDIFSTKMSALPGDIRSLLSLALPKSLRDSQHIFKVW